MKPLANSFRHINQALSFAAMRLQARGETRLLAQEIENARENLCVIEETSAEMQRDHGQAIEAILYKEAQLREALLTLEETLLSMTNSAAARCMLQSRPSELLQLPRGKDRIERVRQLLALAEDAPFSFGLSHYASKLRQCLFGLEDTLRRGDAVRLARSAALRERASGLKRAQQLFDRLVLQTKLLFPKNPFWLSLQEHSLPHAA
jgi:hypothetical protein